MLFDILWKKQKKIIKKKKKNILKSIKKSASKKTKSKVNKKTTLKKTKKKNITKKPKNPIKKKQLKSNKKDPEIKKTKIRVSFDDKIKEILEKLINKHKIDGIYTLKIIEKAIPKKFRVPENIKKLENLISSNNIKIYSEEEAKELVNLAKDEGNKSDESSDEEEKKTNW